LGGTTGHLAQIVQDLSARLQLNDHIDVRIDENNAKMVSSEPLPGLTTGYRISFDREFLESLTDDEITAAIAHELGHVWIFTHHPFLQTETLANDIALRVVDRETMKKVYSKLWAHTGTPGNIDELLGPPRKPEPSKAATILP
jgi:predicted Zn-dependent protease